MKQLRLLLIILIYSLPALAQKQQKVHGDAVLKFVNTNNKYYIVSSTGDTVFIIDPVLGTMAVRGKGSGSTSIQHEGNTILELYSYGNGNSRSSVLRFKANRAPLGGTNAPDVSGDIPGAIQVYSNVGSSDVLSSYMFWQAAEDFKDTGKHAMVNWRWQFYGASNNGAGGMDTSLKDKIQFNAPGNTLALIPSGANYNFDGGVVIGRPNNLGLGRLAIGIGLANQTGLNIFGASGQTANLFQLLNSTGTVLASADANGNIDAPNLIDSVTVRNDSLFEWKNGIKTFRYLHSVGAGGGIASLNSLTGSTQTFATGTSGSDFNISSSGSTHTFNIPTASGTNRGALSPTDWTTFNNKQAALGFTPENTANKATSFSTINNTLFPTVQACTTYVANAIAALSSVYAPITHTHGMSDLTGFNISTPSDGQLMKYDLASGKWVNFTPAYITGNQTITLSGDVSGSGTTAITTTIGTGKVTNAMLAGSIASSKLVGTDIATVGTITTGTWQGSTINTTYIDKSITINAQTGTTYTLQASDLGKIVQCTNASAITVTLPSGLGASFWCIIKQGGAGAVTLAASGTTIHNRQSYTKTAGQYASFIILPESTSNNYSTQGDMQ